MKWRPLSRRAFLGGAGTILPLPFLESLVPKRVMAAAPIQRAVFVFSPNGFALDAIFPNKTGADHTMPPTLAALQPLRAKVSVIGGAEYSADVQHHILSHHSGDQGKLGKLRKIDKFTFDNYAAFLGMLDKVDEGGGKTLLDNSVVSGVARASSPVAAMRTLQAANRAEGMRTCLVPTSSGPSGTARTPCPACASLATGHCR